MTNARQELLDFISNKPEVICLRFKRQVMYEAGPSISGTLEEILPLLNFEYDSGFGFQEFLYGQIWFADGSWATRGEYDGSGWWQHQTPPALPERFQ